MAAVAMVLAVPGELRGQATPAFTITDLGALAGGRSIGTAVNASGQVVGSAYISVSGPQHAVLWTVSGQTVTCTDLGTLGGSNSYVYGINDSGQIVGSSEIGEYGTHAVLWTAGGQGVTRTDLGTLGGDSSNAYGINASGQIVGSAQNGDDVIRAVRWSGAGSSGGPTDLGSPDGLGSEAYGINARGQIVGRRLHDGDFHPTLWNGDVPIDLSTTSTDINYAGTGINATGQIVGTSAFGSSTSPAATWWSVSGQTYSRVKMGDLGGTTSYAYGINASGRIVGNSYTGGNAAWHGFYYIPGRGMTDLNKLVGSNPIATNITVGGGNSINDSNQIAATGYVNGQTHALLLTPQIQPLVFIPGIAGSKLIGNGQTGKNGNNHYLWPTVAAADIDALNLHTGAQDVKAVDVVSDYGELGSVYALTTVYKPFIKHVTGTGSGELNYLPFDLNEDPSRLTSDYLLTQGYGTGSVPRPRFFPFPYDWRKSYDAHTATLHAYITHIRQLYGGAKVNVVAHSAGGLLLRRYILDYGTGDFNGVVTVGSPFLGSPKAMYRLLTGDFYDTPVDWITRPDMLAALGSLPGVHDLLPSDLYLSSGGAPDFYEYHWDINGDRKSDESYTAAQSKALLNAQVAQAEFPLASPDVPSQNNDLFHNYLNGQQDNWRADASGIQYLHICGLQAKDATNVGVIASAETRFAWTPYPQQILRFREVLGAGDGTVPLLSAQRLPYMLAPGTIIRVVPGANPPGANDDAEHTALMGNSTVLAMLDAFLTSDPVPPAPTIPPGTTVVKQHIEITGCGYVTLFNTASYQNTRLSELAAQQIPGVTVHYGGDAPWVDIEVPSNVDLTVQGATVDQVIEIAVTQLDANGNALSFRRYQLSPIGHLWQALFPPSSGASIAAGSKGINAVTAPDPVVSVDANGNSTFEQAEQVAPAFSSGTGPVDTAPPSLDMTVAPSGSSLVVNLTAHDDGTAAPVVLYTMNDGPVQTYHTPLSFPATGATVLKAFAQDGAGNTSGMITTTLSPSISVRGAAGGVTLQWPVADAYVLEETDALSGIWTPSTTQITRTGLTEVATVAAGVAQQRFFRLRAQTVTK